MNFLGHAYFSPSDDDKIIAGNIFGDFVKGNIDGKDFPEGVKNGLRYHRLLDMYCNNINGFIEIKRLVGKKYRPYQGIIADIFIDHLLAINWQCFSDVTLESFSLLTCQKLESCSKYFPERFSAIFEFMKRDNWFVKYKNISTLKEMLKRLERKSGHGIILNHAVNDFNADYKTYGKYFFQFMSEMKVITNL